MAAVKKPLWNLAWSYSRLADYEKCPQLFKFKVIEKRPEPSNEYMERGQRIHDLAQVALLRPKTKIPTDLKRVTKDINTLRALKAEPEAMLTFTHNFKKQTEWFAKDAWARVKVDATAVVTYEEALTKIAPEETADGKAGQLTRYAKGQWVVDWKTGQFKPERSHDQVDLYATAAFLADQKAEVVIVTLTVVDFGRSVHAYYDNPKRAPQMRDKWIKRVQPLQTDVKFKPKPGPQCSWCFFSGEKGGPCKAG